MPTAINLSQFAAYLPLVLLGVVALWILFTLVAAYHLLRYGHQSTVTIPAICIHIVVSGLILAYTLAAASA